MSNGLGTYTFLPWLRHGVTNDIAGVEGTRAYLDVKLRVRGRAVGNGADLTEDVPRERVYLYGPGDIIGIEERAFVKVEPRNWITNFEANYLPYVDFYDEGLPWRYSPATPDGPGRSRLAPWITVLVLKEDEFADGGRVEGAPLPSLLAGDLNVFPNLDHLWGWAHVHVNRSLIVDPDTMVLDAVENQEALDAFEQLLAENPDLAYSRVVSARQLEENTAYHAFLVPTYETGRLAGLGLDPESAPDATHGSWAPYQARPHSRRFPYYKRWYFRTATVGDFEYLVRLLEPRAMDSRVGQRDMDVQRPGANLPGIDVPELGGVLRLGGALKVPREALSDEEEAEQDAYENWDEPYPHAFQHRLAELINLPDDYKVRSTGDAHAATGLPAHVRNDENPDPLITAPLYGRWHALTQRLLTTRGGSPAPNRRNWVHELNLDPRYRTAAGFGTHVVQKNQETYLEAAWSQVGEVVEANRELNQGQLALGVSLSWYDHHLVPLLVLPSDRLLTLTAPLDRRVVVDGATRWFAHSQSVMPRVVVSAPMRRATRRRGPLMKRLGYPDGVDTGSLLERINDGEVHTAPPKVVPPELPTLEEVADRFEPPGVPGFVLEVLERAPWLRFLPILALLLVLLILVLLGVGAPVLGAAAALGGALVAWLLRWSSRVIDRHDAANGFRVEKRTPDMVDEMPSSPDFVLTPPGVVATPSQGATDSPEARRFKTALRDLYGLTTASRALSEQDDKVTMDLPHVAGATLQALDPRTTVAARVGSRVTIPPRIADRLTETFVEAMAYPEIDTPMYKPLVEISTDLFLPNIQYVEQNSISLLETNQNFIESYMVGLNHEFARELLWEEFPTDSRGSYFRQFWDVGSVIRGMEGDFEDVREELRDIPPIHRWASSSELGSHDHREQQSRSSGGLAGIFGFLAGLLGGEEEEDEVVLVIRGELLKKYPTAVIYAQRAQWQRTAAGSIDKASPRELVPVPAGQEDDPPDDVLKTPLYEAKVDPDIYFFGFDLTVEEARGESESQPDDAGWFFVIKERPGEPRFGLDVVRNGAGNDAKHYWNDVSWSDVPTAGSAYLAPLPAPAIALTPPDDAPADLSTAVDPRWVQHREDVQIRWDDGVSAAELAYILYQVPVLMAVHASEMLED